MFDVLSNIPENVKTILAFVILGAFIIPMLSFLVDLIDWEGVFEFLVSLLIMFLVIWAFWYLFL